MNLNELSTEELKELKEKCKKKVDELDNKQMAFKILLNSAYGAIGSPYFRFFNPAQAEAITLSGQVTIRFAEKYLNNYLDKVLGEKKDRICAIDTDSVYVVLDDLVNKVMPNASKEEKVEFLDKVGSTKIQDQITKTYDDLYKMTNSRVNKMEMKREVIGSAVFVNKKRYFMKMYDKEGVRYTTPKAKVMGLEAVRSTTPEIYRNKMKELFMEIFDHDEDYMIEAIKNFKREVMNLPLEKISSSMGVSNLNKYKGADKTVPYNAKAALLYNLLIESKGLSSKYEMIKDGDKVKLCPLVTPNPYRASYFAFPDILPPELELDAYIDREGIFNRSFLEPMKGVFNVINWSVERQATLDAFF